MIDKHFTKEQMQVINNVIDADPTNPKLIALQILAMAAIRGDEFMRLTFADVNYTTMRLTVRRGSKGSDARSITLSPELTLRILKMQDAFNMHNKEHLYCTFSKGTKKTALRVLRHKLDTIKAQHWAGISLPCLHGLRHTKAVRAIEKGHNIYMVKHLLGHKSISSTEHYFPRVDEYELSKLQQTR